MAGGTGDEVHSEEWASATLQRYLHDLERAPVDKDLPPAPHLPIVLIALKRVFKYVVPQSMRLAVTLAATDAIRPVASRRARRLAKRPGPVLVQLGSGHSAKWGWINVDLVGQGADVAWNLRRRLPFEDNTVTAIFHEHLLEHLDVVDGFALTKEVFRVLRPGGIVRVVVPDAERYVRSYAANGDELELLRPDRPTKLLALQELFFRHGHRAAYDSETLRFLLLAAGFASARLCDFGESDLQPAPDSQHRQQESIYVEATKPTVRTGAVGTHSVVVQPPSSMMRR